MRLITDHGMRLDRHMTDLDKLIRRVRSTPYGRLDVSDKADLVRLLAQEHATREHIRFSKPEAVHDAMPTL